MAFSDTAATLHDTQGYNCCQSVFASSCEAYGIDRETAYRLGAFFGSGMRCGTVCGCVTGTLMALGLKYGDENNRQCKASQEFLKAFEEKFGTLYCREILRQNGKPICKKLIAFAADYLEEHL